MTGRKEGRNLCDIELLGSELAERKRSETGGKSKEGRTRWGKGSSFNK